MSRQLYQADYLREFELGDEVRFDAGGYELTGEVVRVYNTRTLYHVAVGETRWEVSSQEILGRA